MYTAYFVNRRRYKKRSKIRCSQCKILSCAIRWFYRCGNFRGRGCVSSLCKKPYTHFAGIKNPAKGDAAGIFKAIEDVLISLKQANNLEDDATFLDAVYNKLVNCNFDGANVMSGSKTGVQTRLREKQPGIVYTHCVAHRLELATLDSLKFDSYLEKFDETINNIFKFYFYSPTRRKELRDLSVIFNEEFKQLGLMKNIRWLASRTRALKYFSNNYKILIYDLETKSYGQSDTAKKARGYADFLKQPKFLFYLHFFQDLVEVLRPLSLYFQREYILVSDVPQKMETIKASVEGLVDSPGDAMNDLMENLTLTNGDLEFKEVTLDKPSGRRMEPIEHSPEGYRDHFYSAKFERMITGVIDYLDSRFRDFEREPVSLMVKLFSLKKWPSTFRGSKELRSWGKIELEKLFDIYAEHGFLPKEDKNNVMKNWPSFRETIRQLKTPLRKDIEVFTDILLQNEEEFKALLPILEIMLTISVSTASCERGFSAMNRQKTSLRTRLKAETLDDIMRITVDGPPLISFPEKKHVESWIKKSSTTRHTSGHKKPVQKRKLDSSEA